jgi:hypothetical protein
MPIPAEDTRPRPGRPRKFGRPSRTVALTLPEDVIAALGRLDPDLGRAVVRLSQPLVADRTTRPPVELARYRDHAVIVVPPVKSLERIAGVTIVPLPDGRALISLEESMSIFEFEVKLLYALADVKLPPEDRSVMSSIAEILKHARKTKGVSLFGRSIIVMKMGGKRQRIADSGPVPQPTVRPHQHGK